MKELRVNYAKKFQHDVFVLSLPLTIKIEHGKHYDFLEYGTDNYLFKARCMAVKTKLLSKVTEWEALLDKETNVATYLEILRQNFKIGNDCYVQFVIFQKYV